MIYTSKKLLGYCKKIFGDIVQEVGFETDIELANNNDVEAFVSKRFECKIDYLDLTTYANIVITFTNGNKIKIEQSEWCVIYKLD